METKESTTKLCQKYKTKGKKANQLKIMEIEAEGEKLIYENTK